jgi:hypothetical protein
MVSASTTFPTRLDFMLSKVDPQHLNLTATQDVPHHAGNLMMCKIWLPRFLYDLLPYFYLTAGFVAFYATLYISDWFWVLPHYLLFSAACLHLAYAVYRRRRK